MTGGKPRVLLVENDPDCRMLQHKVLEEEMGVEVEDAVSVAGALKLIAAGTYDVYVIDFRLGDGTGRDVLTALRERDPEAAAVIVTMHTSGARLDLEDVPGVEIIPKGWTPALRRRLREFVLAHVPAASAAAVG